MTNEFGTAPSPTIRIGAGTAFKLGFFGALGVIALYVIFAIILGVIGAVLFVIGGLPDWSWLGTP
jgi:hypothetical protein